MITDLRFAFRMLVKSPSFTIVAFVALSLGIGVNTTMFGIVNTLLLRPLPVGNPEQLVQIYTDDARNGRAPVSYLNFLDYARQNAVFSGMAAYQFVPMALSVAGVTTNISGQIVSGNYFSVLEVTPALGRGFLPE
jgi:hypothetical protein